MRDMFHRERFGRFDATRRQGKASGDRKTRVRLLRMEALEERATPSVSTGEYAAIRESYPTLNLPESSELINIIEIESDSISCDALRQAIDAAGSTQTDDLVVVRTNTDHNTLTLDGNPIRIAVDSENFGGIAIVALGDDGTNAPLTVDTRNMSRAFSISSSSVALANMNVVGQTWAFDSGNAYKGLVRVHHCALTLADFTITIDGESYVYDSSASFGQYEFATDSEQVGTVVSTVDSTVSTGAPYGSTYFDGDLYMIGDVSVTLVLMESNGAIDTDVCDWSQYQVNAVAKSVRVGLDWWESLFDKRYPNSKADISFTIDYTYVKDPFETSYEPINRSSDDESLWVGEFLTSQGYQRSYSTKQSHLSNLRRFNDSVRVENGSDWAFSIFVVNSRDTDGNRLNSGKFTNGRFGYSWRGGPSIILTYDNNGWTISRMSIVVAHETAHIFWALDEYSAGSYDDYSGYYNIQNYNAQNNPANGFKQQSSILATSTVQISAYQRLLISDSARETIGWRDSDGDGILDAIDQNLTLTNIKAEYDSDSAVYSFTAKSEPVALENLIPKYSTGNDVTINTIDALQYQVDGGVWTTAALYGSNAEIKVGASVSFADLTPGEHTISWRTVCFFTGVTSDLYTASFTVARVALDAPSLAVSVLSSTAIAANVAKVEDADSYILQYSTSGAFENPSSVVLNASGTNTVEGLLPATTYYFRVKATSTVLQDSEWSETVAATTDYAGTLAAPTLTLESISSESVDVILDASENAEYYVLQVSTSSEFATCDEYNVEPGTSAVTNLLPSTTYYFRVKAFATSYVESAWSEVASATTSESLRLDAPEIALELDDSGQIILTIPSVDGAEKFVIQLSANSEFTSFKTATVYKSGNVVLSNLTSGAQYFIRVCAESDSLPASEWSAVLSCVGAPTLTATPSSFTRDSSDSVDVVVGTATGASGYALQYASDSSFTDSVETTVNAGSNTLSGLSKGKTYYIRVRALGSFDAAAWSETVAVTCGMLASTSLTVETVDDSSIRISFESVVNASYYTLQYSTDPEFSVYSSRAFSASGTAKITGLKDDTTYYFRIRANATGFATANWSETASATTEKAPVKDYSLTLSTSAPTTRSRVKAQLSVEKATVSYAWFRTTDPTNGEWEQISGATSSSYLPKTSDVGCYLKVVATGTGDYVGKSAEAVAENPVARTLNSLTISGTAKRGSALTAIVGPAAATVEYQWYRKSDSGEWTPISGAIKKSYIPTSDDVGRALKVVATGSGNYVGTVSATTQTVRGQVTSVTVSGVPKVGTVLTAKQGPTASTATYQWFRESETDGWVAISGATSSSYTPTSADLGLKLKVVATGSGYYDGSASTITESVAEGEIKTELQADFDFNDIPRYFWGILLKALGM